jgi:hypothetical protein
LDSSNEDENFLERIITGDKKGLWIQFGNENAVFKMDWKKFAETEKGAWDQVGGESHVDFFFLASTVLCIINFT